MIICISPADTDCLDESKAIAQLYNETYSVYNHTSLKLLKNDSRITLLGHGNKNYIGDDKLTPEKLTADLISFGLPQTVKTIDLVCCGVGEETLRENGKIESFAQRFYMLLANRGYPNIKIYSFSNTISLEITSEILIATSTSAYFPFQALGNGLTVYGLSPQAKMEFDERFKEADFHQLKNTVDELLNQKLNLKKQIDNLNKSFTHYGSTLDSLTKEYATISEKYTTWQNIFHRKKIQTYTALYASLGCPIYTGTDIRRTLDYNKNFHTSKETISLSSLPTEIKSVLSILNNRIAELKEQLFNFKHPNNKSYWQHAISFFQSSQQDTWSEQITFLENFATRIKNSGNNHEIFICLQEGLQSKALMNSENIKLAKQILQIYSLNLNYLNSLAQTTRPLTI
jgi:hypothetical protein